MSQRAAFAGLLGGVLSALLLVPAVWFVIPAGLVPGWSTVPLLVAVLLGLLVVPTLVITGYASAASGRNDLLDGTAGGGLAGVLAFGACVGPAAAVGGQVPILDAMASAPLGDRIAGPLAHGVLGAATSVYPWFWILVAGGAALGGLGGLARSFSTGPRVVRVIGHRLQGSAAVAASFAAALVTCALAKPVVTLQDRIGRAVPELRGEGVVACVLGTELALLGALLAWCWTLAEGRIHHPRADVRTNARFTAGIAAFLAPTVILVAGPGLAPALTRTTTYAVSALLLVGITCLGIYRVGTAPSRVLPEDDRPSRGLAEATSAGIVMGALFVAAVGPSVVFGVGCVFLASQSVQPLAQGPALTPAEIAEAIAQVYRASVATTVGFTVGATALTGIVVPLAGSLGRSRPSS